MFKSFKISVNEKFIINDCSENVFDILGYNVEDSMFDEKHLEILFQKIF